MIRFATLHNYDHPKRSPIVDFLNAVRRAMLQLNSIFLYSKRVTSVTLSRPHGVVATCKKEMHKMEISIGSKVRSFDFHYRRDLDGPQSCYMEGIVTGIQNIRGCDRYVIEVTRCVSGGEEHSDHPSVIIPPVNGTRTTMGRVTDGVEVIGGE